MAAGKSAFFCQNCGAQSAKWIGKCPSCGAWNTYIEEVLQKERSGKRSKRTASKPEPISGITSGEAHFITLNDTEFNRVLGGGLVPGAVVLLSGEPGIGKSTLLLQVSLGYDGKVLYVSGEESASQIKRRAQRIGINNDHCFLYTESGTQEIIAQAEQLKPDWLIIDSVQTLQCPFVDSSPGSVSQVRESAAEIIRFAKTTNMPVILVGHITKDGGIAGPKVLEHMVDAVIQFEGDRNHLYRLLRTVKNRFGAANELGVYEMKASGLEEVPNPSGILLSGRNTDASGIAVVPIIEGIRPVLVEIQALVSNSPYGTPQHAATGFDPRRLNMLLAVLEKRCGFPLGRKDVFLNVTGGIRVDDPAVDMAVVAAILSSLNDKPIDRDCCFAGEVGLSGEIRTVPKIEQRIEEAGRLGYTKAVISNACKTEKIRSGVTEIKGIRKVGELVSHIG